MEVEDGGGGVGGGGRVGAPGGVLGGQDTQNMGLY